MLSLEEATLKMLQEDLQEETDKEIIDKPQSIGATMKDMYNQLDQTEGITNVEGLVDDILVVTDPEVTSEEYDEVIERAQEIVEDTPEGNVPFDEEYVGQYLLTCPICGTTFVSQQMLEPGATCPACMEVPESFVVKGKIDTDENVAIDSGLQVDEEQKEKTEAVPDTTSIEDVEEPVEEEDMEKQTASKEIPQGNKLQETIDQNKTVKTESNYDSFEDFKNEVKSIGSLYDYVYRHYYKMPLDLLKEIALNAIYEADNDEAIMSDMKERVFESKSIMKEDSYEDGIFYEIEAALMEAGLNPVRFTEDGVLTNNLGWTVRGKDGTKQQITCDGSYLSESLSTENKLQEASQQVPGTEIKKAADEENNKEVSPDQLPISGKDIEVLVTENSVGYLLRGLIIDHKNKQFQYVLGQSLPLGKYKRVSKNTIRNTINDLQNEEYKEYKGKDSIELEESVEYAKFAKFKKLV